MAEDLKRLDRAVQDLQMARLSQRRAHEEILHVAGHLHRCGHSWDWLAHRLGWRTGNALRMAVTRFDEAERRRRTQPTTGATDTTR